MVHAQSPRHAEEIRRAEPTLPDELKAEDVGQAARSRKPWRQRMTKAIKCWVVDRYRKKKLKCLWKFSLERFLLWYGGQFDLPHPYIEVFSSENVSLTGQGRQQGQQGQETQEGEEGQGRQEGEESPA